MKKPPSLQDIATAVGVSKMTVSLVLRNQPKVSDATRAKVMRAARKLGYRPNPQVSKLMSAISRRKVEGHGLPLAYVTTGSDPDDWRRSATERQYWMGAKEQAEAYGYYLDTYWLGEPGMTEQRMSEILWNRGIQGIILHPMAGALSEDTKDTHMHMQWEHFATVAMSYTLAKPVLNRVIHDYYASVLLAIDSLNRKGYERIGFCMTENMDIRVNQRWQAGYRLYCANHPETRISPLICETLDANRIETWIKTEHPDAILGADIPMADYLGQIGINMGPDIAYADLDLNSEDPQYQGISGIDQNSRTVGIAAVDLLMSSIQRNQHGIPKMPLTIQVEGTWRDRGSTPGKLKTAPKTRKIPRT